MVDEDEEAKEVQTATLYQTLEDYLIADYSEPIPEAQPINQASKEGEQLLISGFHVKEDYQPLEGSLDLPIHID